MCNKNMPYMYNHIYMANYTCLFMSGLLVSIIIVFSYLAIYKIEEGFVSYDECRRNGYSKEFCVQTPTSYYGPSGCMCPDGSQGIIHPGLRGECLCSRIY